MLTHMGFDVAYASMSDFVEGRQTGEWESALDLTSMLLPKPLRPHDPGVRPDGGFDAMVVTLPSLFEANAEAADAVLAAAAPLMAPGALLFASATVQMNEVAYEGALSFAEWKVLYAPEGPLGMRGFEPLGGMDLRTPLDTAVRFAANDDMGDSIPGLSYGFLRGFNTSALLAARWPDQLKSGPRARIEYGEPARPDPNDVYIPYAGGEPLAMDAALARAAPAAQSAAFLAVKSLQGYGREALATAPVLVAVAGQGARNALPHIQPLHHIRRTPVAVDLEAPGGAGFILAVQAGDLTGLRLELDLPAGVTFVVRLSQPKARLTRLILSPL
jgi:hypothetical protein